MLRYAVHYNGVDWSRIDVVNAGTPGEMAGAFSAGKGDFVHLQAPSPLPLEPAVSVGASMPPNAFSTLCASRDFIGSPVFRAFAKAFSEAKEWVRNTSPEEVAAKETPYFPGTSENALCAAIAQYQRIGAWEGGIEIPRDLYEQSLNVFEQTGSIRHRHPYDTVCVSVRP
jgi:NitT/TauT family transport system substrate-binding protein